MSYNVDERGSKDQRILYEYLSELYPNFDIIYEFPIHDLGQRIDIFVPNLGIAIEYHGRQHFEFIPHFHKNLEDFKRAIKLDQIKNEYLYTHGIKLIEIPYNDMVESKEALKALIDSADYPPNVEYIPLSTVSEKRKDFLDSQREQRRDLYKQMKSAYKEDPEKRTERLKKEKQQRQEKYKKLKELRK